MSFPFLLGALLGALLVYLRLRVVRRERHDRTEESLRLRQEKELVVRFMHDMVEALGEGLTRPELFQRIVHAAVRCTGALSACVFELTPENTLRGAAVEGLFPPQRPLPESSREKLATRARFIEQVLRSETLAVGEGIIGRVAETSAPELVRDGAADPRVVQHGDAALAMHSLIAAPIVFRGRLIGVLAVANPADGLAFNETDFSLVQTLAEQAGLAVHNNDFLALQLEKRQIDLDLSLAQSIQQMLLPSELPRVPALELDVRYIPAQKVGGDVVDVLALPGERLALAVADVSGKGVAASILMAICRTHLRHALHAGASPAGVLRAVNAAMSGEIRQGMFITALLAIVDPAAGQIVFARAGHEPPILTGRDVISGLQKAEFIPSDGMALGLVGPELFDSEIADCAVPFREGDLFVLYTDGVTEAANDEDKEFSGARLMDAVRTLRVAPCEQLNAGILATLERFTGRCEQRDDLTLVSVRRLAS